MIPVTKRANLYEKATEQALDALRLGNKLHAHPLQLFTSVLTRLASPYALCGDAAVQVAIFDHLKAMISEKLRELGEQVGLAPSDFLCTETALTTVFYHVNRELEAWSLLHYRYVCADSDFSMQQIATLTHREQRNLRRRHELGIIRLTHELIRHEQQARQQEAELRLRLALPVTSPPKLVGVESAVVTALHFLTNSEPPHHLVLQGPAGIGKTALAQVLAHQLIEDNRIEDLLWFDVPTPTPTLTALIHSIAKGFGLPLDDDADPVWMLRAYLLTHPTLIVLDRAEGLLGDQECIRSLLSVLDSANVILTSRILPPSLWCYLMALPGLKRDQALAFLERLSRQQTPFNDNWLDHFDRIWEVVGGNPLELRTVADLARTLPIHAALAHSDHLYESIWQQLSADHQRIGLISFLFGTRGAPYERLMSLERLPGETVDQALLTLVGQAFLAAHDEGDSRRYVLSPPAAAFLTTHLQQGTILADGEAADAYLRRVLRRIVEELVHSPDPDMAVSLLELSNVLDFSEVEHWEIAYKLAAQITAAGLWLPWHQHLTRLLDCPYEPSQAAWLNLTAGTASRWLGHLDEALERLSRALDYYVAESSLRQADVMREIAVIKRYQGAWQDTHRLLQNALTLYRQFDLPYGVERCLHDLAQLSLEQESAEQVLTWLDQVEKWSLRSWGIAGQTYLLLGENDQAEEAAHQIRALLPVNDPHRGRAIATLALIYDTLGESDTAVEHFLLAAELLERSKDMIGYARVCNNLAVAYSKQPSGSHTEPIENIRQLLTEALRIQDHIGDELGLAVTRQNLALLAPH